jgi:phosphatidate cytidylyltransferase
MHELYAMLAAWRPVRLAGFIGAAGIAVAAVDGTPFHVLLAAVAVVPVLFVMVVARPPSDDGATNTLAVAATLLGVYWIGLAIGHAIMLRELPHGDGILIDVLVGTFLGDTGAYLGGRAFGRRRLAARLSPNKTVEGLALGVLTAIASVWFAGLYQDWLPGSDALLIGLGVAIAAPLGDLFESMVKRDAGTKDTGTLFGAHGGALDRLDAVLFSLPVGFYIWTALL